jgi:uncharacterized protein YgiM (DUF1202 family)
MFVRSAFLAAAFSLAGFTALIAAPAASPTYPAEPAAPPEVENSKYQFTGVITENATPVLSGPGENYYATMKLDQGAQVTIVGIKREWLKIVPPEGSFSAVARGFIQKQEGSNVGKVTGDNLNVRAGSSVVISKITVQCKLNHDDEVTIIGEQDGYYRIKPPAGAYLFVNQKYVKPVKQLAAGVAPLHEPTTKATEIIEKKPDATAEHPAPEAEKDPLAPSPVVQVAAPPTTQSVEGPRAQAEFGRLEALFEAAAGKSLIDQPIPELLADFKKLVKNEYLPITMRRTAAMRVVSLEVKNQAREELLATRKQQSEADGRLAKIRADRAEIDQRLQAGVTVYTAVGLLQASSVQLGEQTIFRLTDPATARTLCYIRSGDPKYVTFIDKFVGVKGDLITDPQLSLRTVVAEDIAVVDPARVNKGISAQVVPPSLIGGKAEAQAGAGQ